MHHTASRRRPTKSRSRSSVDVGDYLCSERDLFRIEHLGEERGLVEDCRTGELIYMPLAELLALRRVA
jgi:hypothetical protein